MYSFLNRRKAPDAITDNTIYSMDIKNPQKFEPMPYEHETLETRLKKSTNYRVRGPPVEKQCTNN